MVKLNRLYTRTGDDGTTGLVGGRRVKKNSLRVRAYGDIDELNSFLGWARTAAEKSSSGVIEWLQLLQNELFDIGSQLATAPGDEYPGMICIEDEQVKRLEIWIDECTTKLPELTSFVLPGGTELNSAFHVCRTVCRRAERSILDLAEVEAVSGQIVTYMNRLSDLFFALARLDAKTKGVPEYLWKQPEKKKPS